MNIKTAKLFTDLIEQINFIDLEIDNQIKKCENAIYLILKSINAVKKVVIKNNFKSDLDEIHFFKEVKPQFTSKLIYFNMIYKIEMKRPNGGNRVLKKYYNNELLKLKAFFDNELEFYQYYRSGSNYLDHKYFTRGKFDIKMALDSFYFESDCTFSTSHDFKVAQIIANDLIQVYLENQLHNTVCRNKSLEIPKLHWTGSKTALIELIYALYAQGVFDNGNADIKVIAKTFEHTFNLDLGDFYHTFMELKSRKINRTKFIDNLQDALIRKMDEQDEK